MENQSSQGEPPNDNPSKDPKDNPPGPSKPRTDPSSDSQDQLKEGISISVGNLAYNSPEQKTDDSKHPEPPPPEPVQGPCGVRFGTELPPPPPQQQQQTDGRREGREGPDPSDIPLPLPVANPNPPFLLPGVSMAHPDPPNIPLPPVPQPNPGSDVGQPAANVDDSGQQTPSLLSRIWQTCVDFYIRVNVSAFQLPFHGFLLTWPLATAILGGLSVNHCRINPYLPYVMLVVGLYGTAAGIQRIYVLVYEKFMRPARPRNFWPRVRSAEFIIWVLFVIQLYCFFEHTPSFIPGTKRYCKPKIYMLNLGLICLTSATMIGWIVVNTGVLIHLILRKNARPST